MLRFGVVQHMVLMILDHVFGDWAPFRPPLGPRLGIDGCHRASLPHFRSFCPAGLYVQVDRSGKTSAQSTQHRLSPSLSNPYTISLAGRALEQTIASRN